MTLLPFEIATLIIIAALTVLGSAANSFIVVVNCIEWVKTRQLNSNDIILTGLGVVRFFFQWTVMLHRIIAMIYPNLFTLAKFVNVIYAIWTCLDYANIWFSTLLSIFYWVKIPNQRHHIFIFLKLKISLIVPWLLLGSMLASLVTGIPVIWSVKNSYINYTINLSSTNSMVTNCSLSWNLCEEHQSNSTKDILPKMSLQRVLVPYIYPDLVPMLCIGYSLPFFISCVALLLLIRSLWGHTWHRKGNNCNPSLEVYFTAIKVIVSFLLLYTLNFICIILRILGFYDAESPWFSAFSVAHVAYPSLHSVILILYNPKLKQILERIFLHAEVHSGGDISYNYQLNIRTK
ncbi:taste receptor type 2 member 8-like [Microcaecilia unicolor]|uniref:Taste receptor type 2 n=1 Tax=Microcaecilia unicolor TaxID=1415580 RepID=A0A6P7XBI1_9AMPH|nr:taste receptor type 2 member 8-like [Microcaecilia unicolor]